MDKNTKGLTLGALAAVSYGTNPLFALPLYTTGIGVNSVLFYRYTFAVLIYGIWLKLVKKTSLRLTKSEVLPLFFLGIFFSLSSLLLFEAFHYIEAGVACTILFVYPVMVAILMALFFKEKITKSVLLSISLILTGLYFLYSGKSDGSGLNLHGVLIVLLSALMYALYIVGVKNIKKVNEMNSEKLTFYVMLFGLLVYIYNLHFCKDLQILTTPSQWLLSIGLALFPTILSIETITISIKLIGSTKASILGSLEPITALIIGLTVFHEHLSCEILVGVFAILLGVLVIIINKKKVEA